MMNIFTKLKSRLITKPKVAAVMVMNKATAISLKGAEGFEKHLIDARRTNSQTGNKPKISGTENLGGIEKKVRGVRILPQFSTKYPIRTRPTTLVAFTFISFFCSITFELRGAL